MASMDTSGTPLVRTGTTAGDPIARAMSVTGSQGPVAAAAAASAVAGAASAARPIPAPRPQPAQPVPQRASNASAAADLSPSESSPMGGDDDGNGDDDANSPTAGGTVNRAHTDDIHALNAKEVERHGKYKIISFLASGSYGHVYSATELESGRKVAIKKLTNIFHNVMHAKRLLREVRILRLLDHTNVIRCLTLFVPPPLPPSAKHGPARPPTGPAAASASSSSAAAAAAAAAPASASKATFTDLYIVCEFVSTDLQKLIRSNQHFSNLHIQYFVYQILCGLKYIHSAAVLHRDLKPANLLVNADCSLRICDFGLARQVDTDAAEYEHDPPPAARASKHQEQLHVPQLKSRRDSTSPQRLARQLTKHVVTRWYRAPELILLANTYTAAIDMWSAGCILAELLTMQKENVAAPEDRAALFPGSSCFPLSHEHPLAYTEQVDQLNVIFDVIGTPTDDDINAIASAKARNYLKSLPRKAPISFRARYPGADPKAIDLLQKLLLFDPAKRITAEQAIEHPYLAEVRDAASGVEKPIKMERKEQIMCFAFEDSPLTVKEIKDYLWEEVLMCNPHMRDEVKAPQPLLKPVAAPAAAANGAAANGRPAAAANGGALPPAHPGAATRSAAPNGNSNGASAAAAAAGAGQAQARTTNSPAKPAAAAAAVPASGRPAAAAASASSAAASAPAASSGLVGGKRKTGADSGDSDGDQWQRRLMKDSPHHQHYLQQQQQQQQAQAQQHAQAQVQAASAPAAGYAAAAPAQGGAYGAFAPAQPVFAFGLSGAPAAGPGAAAASAAAAPGGALAHHTLNPHSQTHSHSAAAPGFHSGAFVGGAYGTGAFKRP